MRTINSKILEGASRAWREACHKLGARAFAPSALGPRASSFGCLAFLPDFGGPNGMLIGAMDLPEVIPNGALEQLAKEKGLWYSFVNASAFASRKVVERVFKEALQDWGYFGPPEGRPPWLDEPVKREDRVEKAGNRASEADRSQGEFEPGDRQPSLPFGLDIELISEPSETSHVLLSVGYGTGHVVAQVGGKKEVEEILAFIAGHRAKKGAHWVEVGHFASCPVTLTLAHDMIAVVVDSDLRVGGFGQSAGLYIPRELLDEFVAALTEAHRRLRETGPALK